MSNSFTSPPNMPNLNVLIAGRQIESTTLQRMGELINYSHAFGSTTNTISQTFDDNTCVRDVASSAILCRWRVPCISSAHSSMTFHFDASVTTGTGLVILTITDGVTIGTQTVLVTATSSTYHTTSVTYSGSTSVDTLEVTMALEAPSGGEVEVFTITGCWDSLTSPLAAGIAERLTGDITPMGINRLGASNALSSRVALNFKETIETLRKRPRVIWCWSGITNASGAGATAARGPQALGVGDLPTIHITELFPGRLEVTGLNKVFLAVYVLGLSSGTLDFDFMGARVSLGANGWHTVSIDPDVNSLIQFNDVGIPVYPVGFDLSPYNQSASSPFIDIDKATGATTAPVVPYIASFTSWVY